MALKPAKDSQDATGLTDQGEKDLTGREAKVFDGREMKGLTAGEVEASRARYGSNVLTPAKKDPWWRVFMGKFRDPLIVILLIAGACSIGISIYEYHALNEGPDVFFEPVGIFVAIILATGLAFIFERKAEKEFAILNKVNDDEPVQVVRDGHVTEVARKDVVVGDVVIINTGVEIPADGRLLESVSLSVDESSLTGEPECRKTTDPDNFDPEATFPSDAVMRGTKVMEGHGVMRVEAVGDATENGKVFESAQIDNSVKTPLNEQLDRLGRFVSIASYVIGALIIVGRIIMYLSHAEFSWIGFIGYLLQSVMIAVTLIVVAVPEGLPMAVTLSLAYSMQRMLKTNNLVRKLHACETMGAITVICTDKTGTLTRNQMQVDKADFFGHPDDDVIEEGIAVNSTAELDTTGDIPKVLGNPTEGALLLWLMRRGVDYRRRRQGAQVLAEVPFSTENKYMATEVKSATGGRICYVKGAPEIVYSLCEDKGAVTREELAALLSGYQAQAMRTLGFAYEEPSEGEECIRDGKLVARKLRFLGVAAISDPVREDVPDAVKSVTEAGIAIKIVTGDTPGTAKEIGRRIGLWHDDSDTDANIATGPDVAAMSDEELRRRAPELKIIARARPLDKKRLVEALQADGEVVAVTGDGTNDAPALKAAHVGLSMGDGTSVAKEASDITIIDNSFASIGRAVMWGRSLYKNIQRFILFQLTVNVAACVIVLAGAFMGMESPLTVTQMLWVNLIMDTFAAMALASLPPSASVMKEKPRDRKAFIITPPMGRFILGVGTLFSVLLLALLCYLERTYLGNLLDVFRVPLTPRHELTAYELSMFFTIFVFLQFWNMFNARAFETGRSALHLRHCGYFLLIVAVIFFGQICIVEVGGEFFKVCPLTFTDWCVIILGSSAVLWIGELLRALNVKKIKKES